jgi:hypothetical protein
MVNYVKISYHLEDPNPFVLKYSLLRTDVTIPLLSRLDLKNIKLNLECPTMLTVRIKLYNCENVNFRVVAIPYSEYVNTDVLKINVDNIPNFYSGVPVDGVLECMIPVMFFEQFLQDIYNRPVLESEYPYIFISIITDKPTNYKHLNIPSYIELVFYHD